MKKSNKISFAICGASGMSVYHIKAINSSSRAKVSMIYSRFPVLAKKIANKFDLRYTDNFDDVLKNDNIDAVDIVTEPNRHVRLASMAVKANRHVLIEKPLGVDLENAKKFVELAESSDVKVSVISQKRFDLRLQEMKKRMNSGSIGRPFFAEVKMLTRRDNKYYFAGNGWRNKDSNVLLNQAVHWIDVGLWFFGKPVSVNGRLFKIDQGIAVDDSAVCNILFENGLDFNLVCTTAWPSSSKDQFRILGSKGILSFDSRGKIFCPIKKIKSFVRTPLERQIHSFIDSISENRRSPQSINDAYACLKIIKGCQ